MSDIELCYLSASQAQALFASGDLSPVELMEAVIRRAETVEPVTNAFTYRYYDEAMVLARGAESRFARGNARALEGLPVAVKDSGFIKGLPTSAGSLTTGESPAAETSPINERVLRAGAIVHARSATPEFSCATFTHSRRWGVTRNPWNPAFNPGGSTGGGAASLAAGTSVLATGSDIGGSIRIPASCCGVVGYKPPRGRNPVDAPFNLDSYCHTGPLARTVGDAILLQQVMCGPHAKDMMTLRPRLRLPKKYGGIKDWRIAYSFDLGFYEVDAEVRANMETVLDILRELGARVEQVDLDWSWDVVDAAGTHLTHIFGTSIAPALEHHADHLTDYAREFAEAGIATRPQEYLGSMAKTAAIAERFGSIMRKHRLFIAPTTAIPSLPATFNSSRDELVINDRSVPPMLGWVMTVPFNMMSTHPVLSVPSGRAGSGVPTGVQIVGRTYTDRDVFQAGAALEAAVGGWFTQSNARPRIG